jgi:hypothetical protein
MGDSENEYPVEIQDYEGVHIVWALEYDRVGYFLNVDDAKAYIFCEWDGVREDRSRTLDHLPGERGHG